MTTPMILTGALLLLQVVGVIMALRIVRANRPPSLRPPRVPSEFASGEWKRVP